MRPSYPDARDFMPRWVRFNSEDEDFDTQMQMKSCRALELHWRAAARCFSEFGGYEVDYDFQHVDRPIEHRAGAEPPP